MRHNGETQFCVHIDRKDIMPPVKFRPKLQTLELDPHFSPNSSFDKQGGCRWASSRITLGENIYDSQRSLFEQYGKSRTDIMYEKKRE